MWKVPSPLLWDLNPQICFYFFFTFVLPFQSRALFLITLATMPSITITDGYTFNNWGPVTTTFTAPASCATASNFLIGHNTSFPFFNLATQCSTDGGHGCIPTGTVSPPLTLDPNPSVIYDFPYYSPGLYCPSGWATVGVAARDGDKSPTSSGVLSISSSTITDSRLIEVDFATFKNPATMLPELLDPSETLVVCCPRYV